jgi:hypothetical protein
MANALFIIISPFQLMCASEARKEFCNTDKCHLVVIDRELVGHPSYEHLTAMIDTQWASVVRLQETKKRGLHRAFCRLWLTLKLFIHLLSQRALWHRAVFIGEPRVSWLRILAKIFGRATVWLDDGAASLFLIADMRRDKSYRIPVDGLPHMFTVFGSSEITAETARSIAHNRMNERNGRLNPAAKTAVGDAIIAGQWLSEGKLVSQDEEIEHLSSLKRALADWNVTYIPHRLESAEKLDRIRAIGLPVVRLENPMEIELMRREAVPELLISWYSTVLFGAHSLFPQMAICGLRIPLSHPSEIGRQNIELVYNAMTEAGVRVVDPACFPQFLAEVEARR